jgi:hypothetical protein
MEAPRDAQQLGCSSSGRAPTKGREGIALVPAMLVVSGMAIFAMALMTAVLSGKRTVLHQDDDYRLSSAVESVAIMSIDRIWSGYLTEGGGAAGSIASFRSYLAGLGIDDAYDPDHPDAGPPGATEGTDLLEHLELPGLSGAGSQFNHVNVDAVRIVRRDVPGRDSTQLYLTVSATTNRGVGIVNPVLNRAVQQVYTVEPEDFNGFDYAMLANNVNCIFCHTNVDSVERWFNADPDDAGTFKRIKVGTLETLMLRHDMDGDTTTVNDADADSYIAGTLYVRGTDTDQHGVPIADWDKVSLKGYRFDTNGLIVEGPFGLTVGPFSPAGDPPQPLENLYLEYPTAFAEMVDGILPNHFPAPIPDDGGVSPATGLPVPAAIGNRRVDDSEFAVLAGEADGAITAGIVHLEPPGESITTVAEYVSAIFVGNQPSLQQSVQGNVILTGTPDNPITIDGQVAIDGDVVMNGFVKGEGTLIVRGNVYVPTDLQYLDGRAYVSGDTQGHPSGPRTFGIAQDGTRNALGIAAGGNMLIGDYMKPSTLQPDGNWVEPDKYEIVTGGPDGDWSFVLSEMSLFNRAEWAKTQPMLPGSPGEAVQDPSTWTAVNPNYDPDHVPRYYGFGPGDIIPLYNRGDLYFDTTTSTWRGDAEVPLFWDADRLSYLDPNDPADPFLYAPDGTPKAVPYTLTAGGGWIGDSLYKLSVEYFEDHRPVGMPMKIDGLLYTNNAIFTLVSRTTPMRGRMLLNGALVAPDLGMLVPGYPDPSNIFGNSSPESDFAIGLQLNYDVRVKDMLNVRNPFQVQLKRTLWNPTANIL